MRLTPQRLGAERRVVGSATTRSTSIDGLSGEDIVVQNFVADRPVDADIVESQESGRSLRELTVVVEETTARVARCHVDDGPFINIQFWSPVRKGSAHNSLVHGKSLNELGNSKSPGRGTQISTGHMLINVKGGTFCVIARATEIRD